MKQPRIMITAPKSGSGKTIITCGLLRLLKDRGCDVKSYKCGPDYIDPMFHRSVIDVPGGNLDTFFSSDDEIRSMIASDGCEAAMMEGVMGIYDGITGGSRGSCYDVAAVTETPIILIIDVKGMGQTMLSVIKGILSDDRQRLIKGIILNRISAHYFDEMSPLITEMLSDMSDERGYSVRLLGGIPNAKNIKLESRHLGLMMPGEIDDLKDQVRAAADLLSEHVDTDALLEIMDEAGNLPDAGDKTADIKDTVSGKGLTLAAARDEAFCFYYEENFRMLREHGINIIEFSPLRDSGIPEEADGLLIGGGYPELYAEQLSMNTSMCASVRKAIAEGLPSMAECGGFMYLLDSLKDAQGVSYDMAGVLRGESFSTGKLSRFGYITVSENGCLSPDASLLSGLSVKGHEFHYFDSDNTGCDAVAVKPGSGREWACIHAGKDHIWGYPHLWYPSCPQLVERFIKSMKRYREGRE